MKNQSKKPVKKKPAKKPVEKNSRIKESGGVHWVLHKQHDVRKYKGFKNITKTNMFFCYFCTKSLIFKEILRLIRLFFH